MYKANYQIMGKCKEDVTQGRQYWSYVFLALTGRNYDLWAISMYEG